MLSNSCIIHAPVPARGGPYREENEIPYMIQHDPNDVSAMMNAVRSTQPDPTFQDMVTELAHKANVDVCSLYRLDADRQELVLEASYGLDPCSIGYRIPITKGLTGRVARTGRIVAVRNPAEHPEFHYVPGSGEEQFQTFFGVPIHRHGELVGVLVTQTIARDRYMLSDVSLIQDTGRRIQSFLEKAA